MKLEEAKARIKEITGVPFSRLFTAEQLKDAETNKGGIGQLLEKKLGLPLSSGTLDFEDGELKTNKCDEYGSPLETIRITQLSSMFDGMMSGVPFEHTHLYTKVKNMLYVPVYKGRDIPMENWMFLPSIHVDLLRPDFIPLHSIWKRDYDCIARTIRRTLSASPTAMLCTASGQHLQIRTKDSNPPYHPIYSKVCHRVVSDKGWAFYFKKEFVYEIRQIQRRIDLYGETTWEALWKESKKR